MIVVSSDIVGLRRAALEYFEDAFEEPKRERLARIAADAKNREQVIAGIASKRTLADGYYARVEYLLWLIGLSEMGIALSFMDLLASEVEGMIAVKLARNEFHAEHPPCPQCGARNESFAPRCISCKTELTMKGGR